MELTGKCKEDFEKWYINTHFSKSIDDESIKYHIRSFNHSRLPSEKWGVFEDFFASHNIFFQRWSTFYKDGINQEWQILIYDKTEKYLYGKQSTASYGDNHEYPTPMDARLGTIKKANKIYNGE